ncbi:hypothetical protein [Prevotella rectalis]|uniref:hypothetical protein n=1 Tax=Prevotella rectalis TaxID=2219999 RepID=UPI00102F8D4F|nr:hypothetical protein [Prevotella brunnea]
MKKIFIISTAILLSISLYGQDIHDTESMESTDIAPIESAHLQGPRKATEAEKEYARMLAEERVQQQQIDNNLPLVDENGQVITPNDIHYPYWDYGWDTSAWRLHRGLNVNVGASVFANFGNGCHNGAGFTQDVSLMYVTNLSPKTTLAVGGYFNNMIYDGNNYTSAGINALLGYQFDEHWSAYAFVQKAFTSDNFSPWLMGCGALGYGGFGMGYAPAYYDWGYHPYMGYGYSGMANRFMDRIGGGVTYRWGERNQNSISINVEVDRMPQPKNRNYLYNIGRYGYPVR